MLKRRVLKSFFTTQFCTRNQAMKKKTYKFIASTDSVNSYGYRILTEGLDISQYQKNPIILYMHNRFGNITPTGEEVIGKAIEIKKESDKLIIEVEFDEESPFAKTIAGKVERGFIKMASIGADVIETSTAPELILPGQTLETVTKSKLTEISIVDIGGNDDAIRLCRDGKPIELKQINHKNMTLIAIALALGLPKETNEQSIIDSIKELKLSKDKAERSAHDWKEKYQLFQNNQAEEIIQEAVSLGLIPESLREVQLNALQADYQTMAPKFQEAIQNAKSEQEKKGTTETLKRALNFNREASIELGEKESFDYLQKYDIQKLRLIQQNEPKKYAQLAHDYAKGVRYNKKH